MLKQDEHLWRVGKWERLCTGCDSQQCWESNPDLSVDKYTKNLWTIEILYHVASATNMCARMFEKLVLPMECWVKDCWCCEHIAAVLWYPSYQRNKAVEVLSETDYCGTVNVLEVADINWESKCILNEARIRFTKVHQHLFHHFHHSFSIKVDFYDIKK